MVVPQPGGAAFYARRLTITPAFVAILRRQRAPPGTGLTTSPSAQRRRPVKPGRQVPTPDSLKAIIRRSGRAEQRHPLLRRRPQEGRQRRHRRPGARDRPPAWRSSFGFFERASNRAGSWTFLLMRQRRRAQALLLAAHHPSHQPRSDDHRPLLGTDPSRCSPKTYDAAMNGWEPGGGSVQYPPCPELQAEAVRHR